MQLVTVSPFLGNSSNNIINNSDHETSITSNNFPLHFELETPQDKFLSILDLDKDFCIQNIPSSLPQLDKKTLIKIVELLSKSFVAEAKDHSFKVEFTLIELLQYLGQHINIKERELVGGIVFWLLRDHYLIEFLTALGIKNLELIPDLTQSWEAMPNDVDVRIHASFLNKTALDNSLNLIDLFIANKLSQKNGIQEKFLKELVFNKCYLKRHTHYDKSNHYSTATISNLEILMVKKLFIPSLFVRDALRLNINPLVEALMSYQWNSNKLIEDILNEKINIKIIPESDFHNIWQVVIDRLSCRVRTDKEKYKKINEGGWPILISLLSKGNICIDDELEMHLLKTFRDASRNYRGMLSAPAFWLKKILRNHHPQHFIDSFTVTFNACKYLNASEINALWKEMRSSFSNCDHPVIRTIDSLMVERIDLQEIMALIQAKAFFQYYTKNDDPNFEVILSHEKHFPIFQINLGGSYIQLPFDPIHAFHMLTNVRNDQIKRMMKTFVYPNEPYLTGKKLPINEKDLESFADHLEDTLRCELKLISALQSSDKKQADLFIDDFLMMLSNPRLTNSIGQLPLSELYLKVLKEYENLSNETCEQNLALALVRTGNETFIQKGYSIYKSFTSNDSFKHLFLQSLAITRPDLAMKVLLGIDKNNTDLLIKSWLSICSCCKKRQKYCRSIDLPILLKGIINLLSGTPRIHISKEFLDSFNWLCHELKESFTIEQNSQYDQLTLIFLFLEILHSKNEKKYDNICKNFLRTSLEAIEKIEDQKNCFLLCAKFLIKFLKKHVLADLPFIKKSILTSQRKFFKALCTEKHDAEAVEFAKLLSYGSNRLKWLTEFLVILDKEVPNHRDFILLSVCDDVLKTNPTNQEIHTLLTLYQQIKEPPTDLWNNIIYQITKQKNHELLLKTFDILINFLEKKGILKDPQQRAECWLNCLQGLEYFSDEKIISVFENFPLFYEVFKHPLANVKYEKALNSVINCLKSAFKKINTTTNQDRLLFSLLLQIDDKDNPYNVILSLGILEFLAKSDNFEIFQKVFQQLAIFLQEGKYIEEVEKIIKILIDNLLRNNIAIDNEFGIIFNEFFEIIKQRYSLILIMEIIEAFVKKDNLHYTIISLNLFKQAVDIFQQKKYIKTNEKNKFIEQGIIFLTKIINTNFNYEIYNLVKDFFQSNLLKDFINHKQYPDLLYSFINHSCHLWPPSLFSLLTELLVSFINLIKDNLHIFGHDSKLQSNAIKLVLDLLSQCGIEINVIKKCYLKPFLKSLKSYYLSQDRIKNSKKSKKSKLSTSVKINEYKLYFLDKIINQYYKEEIKYDDLYNFATKWILQFQKTKNINITKINDIQKKLIRYKNKCDAFHKKQKRKFMHHMKKKRPSNKEVDDCKEKEERQIIEKSGSSTLSKIKELSKNLFSSYEIVSNLLCSFGISFYIAKFIFPFVYDLNRTYPICFNVPNTLNQFSLISHKIQQLIPALFGYKTQLMVRFPVINEICFRYLLQDVVLRKMPENLLEKYAPSYTPLVNFKVTKIARILFTSAIFTLANTLPDKPLDGYENCSLISTINLFAIGVFLGLIQEATGKTYLSIASHTGFIW